jgi:hypothetical protein
MPAIKLGHCGIRAQRVLLQVVLHQIVALLK